MSYNRRSMERMGRTPRARLAATVAMLAAFGCAGSSERDAAVDPDGCGPVQRTLAPGSDVSAAEGLAGNYTLTMVRTSGDTLSVVGTLTLVPQVDSLRPLPLPDAAPEPRPTIPLIGTAEIAVEDVGAHRLGALDSDDPMRPGVIMVHRPGEITMRFGSDVNIREMPAFDGGYLAFFVAHVDSTGFAGGWSSGVQMRDAEGFFCAVRAAS